MKSVMQKPLVFLDSYIDSDLCDLIVKQGKGLDLGEGEVYKVNREQPEENKMPVKNFSIRKANTAFFEKGHWVESIVSKVLHAANAATWQARLSSSEPVQFGLYGQGEFYGKHRDIDGATPINRKISITIQLTDPKYYRGGDFVLWGLDGDKEEIRDEKWRNKGSVLVFPSFLYHEVEKVTKGTRASLVQWYAGPEWN